MGVTDGNENRNVLLLSNNNIVRNDVLENNKVLVTQKSVIIHLRGTLLVEITANRKLTHV